MTTVRTRTAGQTRRRAVRTRVVFLVMLVTLLSGSSATLMISPGASRPVASGYGWPVKPFNRPHPIRGHFGDPRTAFYGPPSAATLKTGNGEFQTHHGIDISATDGTPVYPVQSGVATLRRGEEVIVPSPEGRRFEYWHLIPLAVHNGQYVTAYSTVLGYIRRGYEHVHLTEWGAAGPLNPLARGHLRPYYDRTKPQVKSVSFRDWTGSPMLPELVHGTASLAAEAYDMPSLRVKGDWHDLPVAPALLTWKVRRLENARTVVPSTAGFDVRRQLPQQPFWTVYARGTRQNMSAFGRSRAYFQPGVYLYRLGSLSTKRLPDGAYELTVTARDTRGNAGSLTQVFSVRNRSRWPAR